MAIVIHHDIKNFRAFAWRGDAFGFPIVEELALCFTSFVINDGWRVFSTLGALDGVVRANDFYALADSQIAMGPGLRLAPRMSFLGAD